jgi:hypothetical protein
MKEKDKKNSLDNKSEKFNLYMGEAGISVSLTSFMTMIDFFFIGLLLTGSPELQIRVRVPLVFLFISAFGFLYSTLIYANASGEISRLRRREFDRQMRIANIMSEYWGVYCLVFASPLVILGYSPDRILPLIVLVISIFGFYLYHHMGFSILERYTKKSLTLLINVLLLSIYTLSFLLFYFDKIPGYYVASGVLLFAIQGLFIYSMKKKER